MSKAEIDPEILSFKDLISISKLESCCFKNKPSFDVTSLSTCVHIKKCFFKSLIGKLQQAKLKWYQVIIYIL